MNATDVATSLTGIFAPITTPFDEREDLDLAALTNNMDRYARSGLRGYLVLGSNGENRSLDEEERLRLLDVVVAHRGPDQAVMAGATYAAARHTEGFLAAAAARGVDFGLVLPPDYFRAQMTDDVLVRYYESLADTSPIPLLLYHAPPFCSVGISRELAERLADHPGIVGLKFSASQGIEDYLTLERPGFHVLAGSAGFLFPAMLGGSLGGTVSLANYLPEMAVALHDLAVAGDIAAGEALHARIARINREVSGSFGVAGVKAAMDLTGLAGGMPRRPLLPLSSGQVTHLRGILIAEEVLR